jgi:hypothetical protein
MENNEILELNVGGEIFSTTVETLRASHREDNHFFRTLVVKLETNEIPITKDKQGRVFIDRNPSYFNYILDYLRDGMIQFGLSEKELNGVLQEATFYSLTGLRDLIMKQLVLNKPPQLLWGYAKYRVASYDGLCLSTTLSGCDEFKTLFRQHKLYEHQVIQIAEENNWRLVSMSAIKSTSYQHVVRMVFKKFLYEQDNKSVATEENSGYNDDITFIFSDIDHPHDKNESL